MGHARIPRIKRIVPSFCLSIFYPTTTSFFIMFSTIKVPIIISPDVWVLRIKTFSY